MHKGDEATCMYILYSGKVGIFVDNECTIKVAEVVPNQVFGEKALENNNKRGASVKALMECKLLCLKKVFYQSIVQVRASNLTCLGRDNDAEIPSVRLPKDYRGLQELVFDQALGLQHALDREDLQTRRFHLQARR